MSAHTVIGQVIDLSATRRLRTVRDQGALSPDLEINRLCWRMGEVCAAAVDALEIAAALEAEAGLTADALRTRYGCTDVFELADEMYRRTARRPVEPAPAPDPWGGGPRTHVLHGLLYGLPALCYAEAAPLLTGDGPLAAVIGAMMVAWTLGQGLAFLGYRRLGALDRGAAAGVLRAGLVVGTVTVAAAVAATATSLPVPLPVAAFAVAEGAYLLAATVLLVLGIERLLLVALAPAVLAGVAHLVLGTPVEPAGLGWLPLVVAAVLAVVFALVATWRAGAGRVRVDLADLPGALPHALFGLTIAGLLALPVAAVGFGVGAALPDVALLTLPLSLSMGAAEWSLVRYRRQVQALLGACTATHRFGPGARRLVLAAHARYLAVAGGLIAATQAAITASGAAAPTAAAVTGGLSTLALGGALFAALMQQTVGTGPATALACAVALAIEAGGILAAPSGWGLDVVDIQLFVGTGLLAVLLVRSCVLLARVTTHI